MKSRLKNDGWVLNKPIAHRGLVDETTFENTYSAYEKAIKSGYPIEMDVQLTSDGIPVCVHDDNLKRITGNDVFINDITLEEAERLTVGKSDEHIPLFEDFLKFIGGRTPLMIEIKMQRNKDYDIAKIVVDMLKNYEGEYVIQSFDPRILGKVKKYAPKIIRGQLAGAEKSENLPFSQYLIVKYMLANFISKPDYVNYKLQCMPKKIRLPHVLWTIKSEGDRSAAEKFGCNYVFENIRP